MGKEWVGGWGRNGWVGDGWGRNGWVGDGWGRNGMGGEGMGGWVMGGEGMGGWVMGGEGVKIGALTVIHHKQLFMHFTNSYSPQTDIRALIIIVQL